MIWGMCSSQLNNREPSLAISIASFHIVHDSDLILWSYDDYAKEKEEYRIEITAAMVTIQIS
eukprot:scaffold7275_cov233-Chaetoceros_neogracile.AAC.9